MEKELQYWVAKDHGVSINEEVQPGQLQTGHFESYTTDYI